MLFLISLWVSILIDSVTEETFWRNYFYRVSLIKQDPNFTTANTGASLSSRSSSVSEGPDEDTGAGEFVSDSFQNEDRKDLYKLGTTRADAGKLFN